MKILKIISTLLLLANFVVGQQYIDKPFLQDFSEKYDLNTELITTKLFKVRSDRNGVINILSENGILHPYEKELSKDLRYRPLLDVKIISLKTVQNQFVYLTDKAVFSYAWAGKKYIEHDVENPIDFAIVDNFNVLIGAENKLVLFQDGKKSWEKEIPNFTPIDLIFDEDGKRFYVLSDESIYMLQCPDKKLFKIYSGKNLTAIELLKDEIIVGTSDGVFKLDNADFKPSIINKKLPNTEITSIKNIDGKLWFGSKRGAFTLRDDGKYDYYASKRWLVDDEVVDISKGPENCILVLTITGLSKINFVEMTLADKAEYFQKIQRLRHIRYGFSSETYLKVPGDLSTAVLHDTDNDGLWTSMYLAGELFRYAVTKSEDAKQNAYEAFEAMERLTEISGIHGFPARTYEIDSYQSSDTDPNMKEEDKIWQLAKDNRWRWKSTTSSDESCGHFFVYALFAELAPDKEWRDRAIHQLKIEMDHIIENDWYLKTWNGEITQWGRWNPDYVNKFSIHTGDRRLNSSLILAFLQATYHFTGDEIYKEKAFELMNEYGYDDNAALPATVIGFVEGENLSDSWNHSDDEMYFITIPNLVNYAFNPELKQKYFDAAESHWEIERNEKNPLWNYMYALIGGKNIDSEESAWWLREYPLDLITWRVENNHRNDLEKLEPNFREQEFTEVLPQDERPLHLHNGAYRNNGGSGGRNELPPYVYLLPYWAGRYVEAISAPQK
ncbi:MAG: hypothetical protein H6612_14800 [Ignavibacteriales bacterium]|nr:hypothetical protein [Ignavibacteriales bacterium]